MALIRPRVPPNLLQEDQIAIHNVLAEEYAAGAAFSVDRLLAFWTDRNRVIDAHYTSDQPGDNRVWEEIHPGPTYQSARGQWTGVQLPHWYEADTPTAR